MARTVSGSNPWKSVSRPTTAPGRDAGTPIDRRAALWTLLGLAWGTHALAQTPASGAPTRPPTAGPAGPSGATASDWPRVAKAGGTTISVHLPQVDSWDGHRLQAHAAVSIATSEKATPAFGVVEAAW